MFWKVLGAGIIGVLLTWWLMQGSGNNQFEDLPWHATQTKNGQIKALGLTTNTSTLRDAIALYGNQMQLKIFTDQHLVPETLEAYFETIYLGGLKGALILTLATDRASLQPLVDRAAAVTALKSGGKELLLNHADKLPQLNQTIKIITFVPRSDLDEAVLQHRFGQPQHQTTDDTGVQHWFYPQQGIEVLLNPNGQELFQYYPY